MVILPLEVSAGEDFYLPIQYQIQIDGNSSPIDISAYYFEMQIGLQPFMLPPIIEVTSTDGQIIVDGPNGIVNIYIPNSITSNPYYFGNWLYAVKARNSIGLVERLFGGPFQIKGWY